MATFPEARGKHTGICWRPPFAVAASAAQDGMYGGCQIWVNCTTIIGKHGDVEQVTAIENLSILLARPRILVVLLQTSCFQVASVCIHGPDSTWSQYDIDAWWEVAENDVRHVVPRG